MTVERLVVDYSVWGFAPQVTVGRVGSQRGRVREGDSVVAVGDGVPDRLAKVVKLRDRNRKAVIQFLEPLPAVDRAS